MGSVNHGFEPEPIAVDNDGGVIPASNSGPGITQTGPRAPEYVALHRTPAVLQINEYLTEEQKKCKFILKQELVQTFGSQ